MSYLTDIDEKAARASVATAIQKALGGLNVQPAAIAAGHDILREGDEVKALYLVESGWVYSYTVLPDGQRQILFLYQPGDIAGFADLGATQASCSLRSLRDCVVHPIPISELSSPSFLTMDTATFLLKKSAQMQSILMRTLVAVGRMEARHRIIWLILMLHDRLSLLQAAGEVFEIPLNQTEIGDLVGLTNVSVSKMLCQLSGEGYIQRKGGKIMVCRRSDMQEMIGYEDMNYRSEALFDTLRVNPTLSQK